MVPTCIARFQSHQPHIVWLFCPQLRHLGFQNGMVCADGRGFPTKFAKGYRALLLAKMNATDQHDQSACCAQSIVSSGFVNRGWALIQSIASCSEVNFPKWCTARLGHTIFTRQIMPSCTGDKQSAHRRKPGEIGQALRQAP